MKSRWRCWVAGCLCLFVGLGGGYVAGRRGSARTPPHWWESLVRTEQMRMRSVRDPSSSTLFRKVSAGLLVEGHDMPIAHLELGRYLLEHEPNPEIRERVLYALNRVQRAAASYERAMIVDSMVFALCHDADSRVRAAAAALLRLKEPELLEPHRDAIEDALKRESDPEVREHLESMFRE